MQTFGNVSVCKYTQSFEITKHCAKFVSSFQTHKTISRMKQVLIMAIAVALGVVLATVINKKLNKAGTTTT